MSVTSRLLTLAQTQKRRHEMWTNLLWASGVRNTVLYTFFRSRGFLARRVSHKLIGVIELVGFSLCVSPEVFYVAGGVAVVSLVLSTFTEAMIHSLRSALLYGENIPVSVLTSLSLMIAATGYLFALYLTPELVSFFPLALYTLARVITSFVSIAVMVRTAEINIRRRVFFPFQYNFGFVAASLAIFLFSTRFKALPALYILVAGHFILNIVSSVLSLYLAKRAEDIERMTVRSVAKGLTQQNWWVVAKRLSIFMSEFVQPMWLVLGSATGRLPEAVLFAWVLRPLALSIISRPFRSLYVDLFGAILRQQWELIAMRIRNARNFSASILLCFLVGIFIYAISQPSSAGMYLFYGWLIVSMAVQFFINQTLSIGQELRIFRPVMGARVLFPSLAYLAHVALAWDVLPFLFLSEAATLLICLVVHGRYSFSDALTYDHARNKDAKRYSASVFPSEFLSCFGVMRPILNRFGFDDGLYKVTLRRSVRSAQKMQELLDELGKLFRSTDRIMALDSRHLLVWAPCSKTGAPMKLRLITQFPLQIENFAPTSIETLFHNRHVEGVMPNVSRSILNNANALLALLELKLSEIAGRKHSGTWWALDERGHWVSLTGTADPVRSREFFRLKKSYAENPILFRNRGIRSLAAEESFLPFRPYGQVIAVYAVDEASPELLESLSELSDYFLLGYLNHTDNHVPTIAPTYWYAVRSVLRALEKSRRLPIRVVEVMQKQRIDSGSLQLCARTQEGAHFIDLGFELKQDRVEGVEAPSLPKAA